MGIEAMEIDAVEELRGKPEIDIIAAYNRAQGKGDRDLAHRIAVLLPLHPCIADRMKKEYGITKLKAMGYDLSEAIERFGEEWLND